MASKVDICNMALQNLGANFITSITEDTARAIQCNLRYDIARKALLNMHPWNFAMRRAALNLNTSTPAFNYSYEFTLPSDFLWLYMTGNEEKYTTNYAIPFNDTFGVSDVPNFVGPDRYRIERNSNGELVLLSQNATANIIYVSNVEDTQSFSGVFTELFARYLSALIASKIVGSKSERDTQMAIFKEELDYYQSIDSQQGTFDSIQVSEYLSLRD